MTALEIEQHRADPAFRTVAIVDREPSARSRLRTAAYELGSHRAAWHELAVVASSEGARAQDIARRAEERDADVVVMTVHDARLTARWLLTRGIAVLAVPLGWRRRDVSGVGVGPR